MDFFEALKIVKDGGAVTRHQWHNPDYHVRRMRMHSPDEVLVVKTSESKAGCLPSGDGFYHKWLIGREDLDAADWEPVALVPSTQGAIPIVDMQKQRDGGVVGLASAKNASPRPVRKMVDPDPDRALKEGGPDDCA